MANVQTSIEGDMQTDLLLNYKQLAADRGITLGELADQIERDAGPVPGDPVSLVVDARQADDPTLRALCDKLRAHGDKVGA